ncbi:hypothetical protein LTS07_002313 [Exophiala sideris]|uniref:tRNA (adenine(58)-N(1))-methyltransferase catalytic subunit TRM61 n=1 Tax=Exophiala sideris TaxID=1016849 RepID=A0ABR0JLV8_9EURO|nr:hypothetical protein LTS07_002313 [Exophiala sideris]KAK5041583.1 hypothetical protein LTR13_002250 [Exophiala sideris]KAK5066969.1 hypothetical protein LTR69_002317 [Exophiala sideris]KAK5185028.1 hypothetical protein LTR44_002874 [Eurotiomycetes sp. CCFEE 6388]
MQVYASYASTIVSLLDLHPVPWTTSQSTETTSSPSLEILEAGTGHGSLTLHIAREIAAANPPPLTINAPQIQKEDSTRTVKSTKPQVDQDLEGAWNDWKRTRKAVLHTVEKVEANRWHAEKVVRGFRQGLYWPHVDFYVGDVRTWVEDRLKQRRDRRRTPPSPESDAAGGFLDYVLLDMPGVETQLRHVHTAMPEGAKLVVFAPSVTQIGQCIRIIQEASLPLRMEKVLELGEGISNGRQWDVRMVRPRRLDDSASEKPTSPAPAAGPTEVEPQAATSASEEITISSESAAADERELPVQEESTDEPVMICRPLVGERTIGGGFIGLFKKMSPESVAVDAQWRRSQTGMVYAESLRESGWLVIKETTSIGDLRGM